MDLAGELAAWATATGAAIAAIGLLLTARQLKIQNRQHRLDWGMAYSARFWAIDDELTMTDPASDPGRYTRLQKRYLKLREDEFDAARLSWLDATQWAVWHSAYLRPRVREQIESAIAQHGDDLDLASLKACLGQTKSTGPHASSNCAGLTVPLD